MFSEERCFRIDHYLGKSPVEDIVFFRFANTLLAMDPFSGRYEGAVRDEKARFLRGVRTLSSGEVVRGQYRGYRDTDGVDPESTVETYAAIRLSVDTWR